MKAKIEMTRLSGTRALKLLEAIWEEIPGEHDENGMAMYINDRATLMSLVNRPVKLLVEVEKL